MTEEKVKHHKYQKEKGKKYHYWSYDPEKNLKKYCEYL